MYLPYILFIVSKLGGTYSSQLKIHLQDQHNNMRSFNRNKNKLSTD